MNPIYHLALAIIIISSVISDLKKIKQNPAITIGIYSFIFIIAIGLWITQFFEWGILLPTQILLKQIYPWMQGLIHPGEQ